MTHVRARARHPEVNAAPLCQVPVTRAPWTPGRITQEVRPVRSPRRNAPPASASACLRGRLRPRLAFRWPRAQVISAASFSRVPWLDREPPTLATAVAPRWRSRPMTASSAGARPHAASVLSRTRLLPFLRPLRSCYEALGSSASRRSGPREARFDRSASARQTRSRPSWRHRGSWQRRACAGRL